MSTIDFTNGVAIDLTNVTEETLTVSNAFGVGGNIAQTIAPTYYVADNIVHTDTVEADATDIHYAADVFKDEVLSADFHQEAPRCRSILVSDPINGSTPRYLAFPWVSTALIEQRAIAAYFHNKPWNTPKERLKVFRSVPSFMHPMSGYVCVGEALGSVLSGAMTPAEAFWMTTCQWTDGKLYRMMRTAAVDNTPKNVLKIKWQKPYWVGALAGSFGSIGLRENGIRIGQQMVQTTMTAAATPIYTNGAYPQTAVFTQPANWSNNPVTVITSYDPADPVVGRTIFYDHELGCWRNLVAITGQ